ncbi:MAG: glycosyltransferase [Bacteroidota bacterium]|jgi:glycosyltransferase involved in cell wall biosynthesis
MHRQQLSTRVVVSVISDLATDQRVLRTCRLLASMGLEVHLLGRLLPNSPALEELPFKATRLTLWFRKGPLFYLEFQWRLLRFLLREKPDIYYANDLDTLLPNRLLAYFRKKPVVYDSHEFFTGVPELLHAPLKRGLWTLLEKWLVPGLRHCITVNQAIAKSYSALYGNAWVVVRNIPESIPVGQKTERSALGLPEHAFIMVMQGSGINVDRGAEEAILALKHLPEDVYLLMIGGGDVYDNLPEIAASVGVTGRLIMKPRMPYRLMMEHTRNCNCGLSLDKPLSQNYRNSLPNKLFDYFHAGIPVVVSCIPELEKIVSAHNAGLIIGEVNPMTIADAIKLIHDSPGLNNSLREGAMGAAKTFTWQNESQILKHFIEKVIVSREAEKNAKP